MIQNVIMRAASPKLIGWQRNDFVKPIDLLSESSIMVKADDLFEQEQAEVMCLKIALRYGTPEPMKDRARVKALRDMCDSVYGELLCGLKNLRDEIYNGKRLESAEIVEELISYCKGYEVKEDVFRREK